MYLFIWEFLHFKKKSYLPCLFICSYKYYFFYDFFTVIIKTTKALIRYFYSTIKKLKAIKMISNQKYLNMSETTIVDHILYNI